MQDVVEHQLEGLELLARVNHTAPVAYQEGLKALREALEDGKNETKQFVEVEVRENTEAKTEDSNFYFKCTTCHNQSVATNGHLVLTNPLEPASDPTSYETNYIYCPSCEILENMDEKTFKTQVFITEPGELPKNAKADMVKKIREEIFK